LLDNRKEKSGDCIEAEMGNSPSGLKLRGVLITKI